jgi:hypothetical protein
MYAGGRKAKSAPQIAIPHMRLADTLNGRSCLPTHDLRIKHLRHYIRDMTLVPRHHLQGGEQGA